MHYAMDLRRLLLFLSSHVVLGSEIGSRWQLAPIPQKGANATPATELEIRVTKGLGSKGYEMVRLSVVASSPDVAPDFPFSYRGQFKYRWTQNYLLSSLLSLQPGENTFRLAGQSIKIDLPAEDSGIRGFFVSDPCFSSKYVVCSYSSTFQTLERSTKLLNAAFEDESMNLLGILGDNFYDQDGEISKDFFSRVSQNVKRRFWMVVNGNHDNWVCGFPACGGRSDNFGIGQMQYYPMDSVASGEGNKLFDFVDPDGNRHWNSFLNNGTNFFFYHKLGNVGFLGYSGAAQYEETLPQLHAACNYFAKSKPEVIFLLGHWNNPGDGCPNSMSVPSMYETLRTIPDCKPLQSRLKYMDGHEHCNYVQAAHGDNKYGFMIGGHGMADINCRPQYGFAYLDTTGGSLKLHYFEVGGGSRWGTVASMAVGLLLGTALGMLAGLALTRLCECARNRKTCTYVALSILGLALGIVAGFFLGVFFINPLFPMEHSYDSIMECLQKSGGLHACTHLATEWLNQPIKNASSFLV